MTNLDWICALILLVFSFIGFRRGLIGEFFRIAAVLIGLLAAFIYSPLLSNTLVKFAPGIPFKGYKIIAFIAIFIAFAGIVVVCGIVLRKIIRLTILGWIDRAGGVLIGALKGLFIIGFFIWILSTMPSLASVINLNNTKIAGKATKVISFLWEMANKQRIF